MAWVIDEPTRFRVRRSAFVDPAVADRERAAVFERCWLYVGHTCEVPHPGSFVTRSLVGRALILVRGADDAVRVLLNACRHRGTLVCREPAGKARSFRCPYHGWVYDSTGALTRVPGQGDYPELDLAALGLESPPRVGVYRGLVFAALSTDVPTLEEHLAPVRPFLDLVLDQGAHGMELAAGLQRYRIRGNWKLLADNCVDVHHVPWLHQRWLGALRADGVDLLGSADPGGRGHGLAGGHAVAEYEAPWGRVLARWSPAHGPALHQPIEARRRELIERLGEERGTRVADWSRNILVFPNLVVNDLMSVTLRTFHPVTPAEMEVRGWALAPVDEDPELRALRLDRFVHFLGPSGFAHADDIDVIESCQRGFDPGGSGWSDYSRGLARAEPRAADEAQMRGFWREWAKRMEGP